MIIVRSASDPIAAVSIAGACAFGSPVESQDERTVGKVLTDAKCIDCADSLDAESARTPLVGERAVDEAVGEHPLPDFEGGSDRLRNMVGAAGRKEQRLSLAAPPIIVAAEQQLANRFRAFAAAGLAGDDDIDAAASQRFRKRLDLRRLADPLPPF